MSKSAPGPAHDALFALVSAQAGHFTAAQARTLGFTDKLLHHYVSTGRFLRRRRGVYRFRDFPATRFEDLAELLLSAGPTATFSHETALVIHDLADLLPGRIHIAVPRSSKRRVADARVQLHRLTLAPSDVEQVEGLRVTTATRTLRDVAGRIEPEQFEVAVRQALSRGLTDQRKLRSIIGRPYGRPWRALRPFVLPR